MIVGGSWELYPPSPPLVRSGGGADFPLPPKIYQGSLPMGSGLKGLRPNFPGFPPLETIRAVH